MSRAEVVLPPDVEYFHGDDGQQRTLKLVSDGISLGLVTVDFGSRCWRLGGMNRVHPVEYGAHKLTRGGRGWQQRLVNEAIAGLRESVK